MEAKVLSCFEYLTLLATDYLNLFEIIRDQQYVL